jgi:putative transcriptional regulator
MPESNTYLTNQFLIAMPALNDANFSHSVTYLCEHNENGAIGIMINQPLDLNLSDIFAQMDITFVSKKFETLPVLSGGPLHPERGFVIHTAGGVWRSSLDINSEISITTSRDVLEAIAQDKGPMNAIVSLGYVSWEAGQLEKEIMNNHWLTCPANTHILFKLPFAERWEAAMGLLGVDISQLSSDVGHA